MSRRPKKTESVNSYCVKCKESTPTSDARVVQTKNGRYRLVGKCGYCNSTKSSFVSKQTGEGLLSGLLGFKNGFPFLNQIPIIGQLL